MAGHDLAGHDVAGHDVAGHHLAPSKDNCLFSPFPKRPTLRSKNRPPQLEKPVRRDMLAGALYLAKR